MAKRANLALRSRAEQLGVRIAAKSDGNPRFVFGIIWGLHEQRLLTRRPDGSWETTGELAEISVPSTVVDLILARMAGVDERERQLLDVAACLGYEFDPGLVAAVGGDRRDARPAAAGMPTGDDSF